MSKVVPLKWQDGELLILDQRKLPGEIKWIAARNHETVAKAIESLAVRGAPVIGIAAAYGVALAGASARATKVSVELAIARLGRTRPTGFNLFWALERMRVCLASRDPVDAGALLREAKSIHREDAAACQHMAEFGAGLMDEGESVLTYCNTGALATGGIGTALGVIRAGYKAKKVQQVFACETRPVGQGARLTVWECVQERIPVTLICDNMVAALMTAGRVHRVFVGADRIARNGDTSNKIGTSGVAILAYQFGIPFHVVAPSTTFDGGLATGAEIVIEERSPTEVLKTTPGLDQLPRVNVWNPAFDLTPAKFITSIITERGVYRAPYSFSVTDSNR
ncbi:MAG: S-methyl-5-thioribose-1-phosphate isomerase [bacterium]|nr:S-methyl-5-thioribose-1-phosphate isomerase [bacterium]